MNLDEYKENFNAKSFITKLRYNTDLLNELIAKTTFLLNNPTNSERMYCWYHNITEIQKCPHCGKPRKFHKFTYGYFPTCGSKECRAKSVAYGNKFNHNFTEMQKKMRETYAKNHNGYTHNMQDPVALKKFMENKKENTIKRYLKNNNYSIISIDNNFYNIQCNKCKTIYKNILGELIPYNLRKNIQFCNNCYNNKSYTVRSKFEDDVYQYILKITNETEKIICNRKVGEHFYIYDIVLYNRNLVIECNGIYFHSDQCINDNEYHYKKLKNANDAGYNMLQIWQDDWYNNNEIIKNKILQIINPNIININSCNIIKNNFYINNQCILTLNIYRNIIDINYISNYLIIDLLEYLQHNYNTYIIKHNLDYPLYDFEKNLTIIKYKKLHYYLFKHEKILEYKKNLPKIYCAGIIYLKI